MPVTPFEAGADSEGDAEGRAEDGSAADLALVEQGEHAADAEGEVEGAPDQPRVAEKDAAREAGRIRALTVDSPVEDREARRDEEPFRRLAGGEDAGAEVDHPDLEAGVEKFSVPVGGAGHDGDALADGPLVFEVEGAVEHHHRVDGDGVLGPARALPARVVDGAGGRSGAGGEDEGKGESERDDELSHGASRTDRRRPKVVDVPPSPTTDRARTKERSEGGGHLDFGEEDQAISVHSRCDGHLDRKSVV